MNRILQLPTATIAISLLLGVAAFTLFADPFVLRIASRIAILALGAVAVDLVLGYAGYVSFGHAAFFGTGVYVTGILMRMGVQDALLAWPIAIAAGMALAFVTGAMALRTSGIYFIMVTLAFAQMLYYGANAAVDYGGADGFRLAQRNTLMGLSPFADPRIFFLVTLAVLVTTLFFARRAMGSVFGAAVRAVRDDSVRAAASGIHPFRHRLAVLTISGGIAALAGALATNLDLYVSPSSAFSWHISAEFLIFVIIGSAGTLIGPAIGAALYIILVEILSSFTDHWMLAVGIILLVRVLVLKRGLYDVLIAGRAA